MIDVVIATYNRSEHAFELAKDLSNYNKFLAKIIIVDSSDNFEKINSNNPIINHIHSSHKNQPYQRYLGASLCSSEIVLFLDDDMSLIDKTLFEDLNYFFKKKNIIAVNLNFKNINNFLQNVPKSLFTNKKSRFLSFLIGNMNAEKNKYIYCGIKGERISNEYINYLSGGSFACSLKFLYSNFNFQLFDLYENKLGKGEDGIMGYTISRTGNIWSAEKQYFLHNDYSDSTYSTSYYNFSKRVMFSRLFLSYEYYRQNNKPLFYGFIRYQHYALGRILGSIINCIVNYERKKIEIFMGNITGWLLTYTFYFKYIKIENSVWSYRLKKDLDKIKLM